jgi:hypothetical protein
MNDKNNADYSKMKASDTDLGFWVSVENERGDGLQYGGLLMWWGKARCLTRAEAWKVAQEQAANKSNKTVAVHFGSLTVWVHNVKSGSTYSPRSQGVW